MRGWVLLLLLLVGAFVGGAAPETQPATAVLRPLWNWQSESGVEWVEVVGRGAKTLLVATGGATLEQLDPATGARRMDRPIRVAPGVRPAERSDNESCPPDCAYAYDRQSLYALQLSEPPDVRWQVGSSLGGLADVPGDPEALTGWVATSVTRAGVLAVHADGYVSLRSYSCGHELWRRDIGEVPMVRLHACGKTAAVLWKTRGTVRVLFIDVATSRPADTALDVGQHWPLWSGVVGEALLTLESRAATLWYQNGRRRKVPLYGTQVRAAAVGVFRAAQALKPPAASGPVRSPLLQLATPTGLVALDLTSGKRAWSTEVPLSVGEQIETLTVDGWHVLAECRGFVSVHLAANGKYVGRCSVIPGDTLVSAVIDGDELFVLGRPSAPEGESGLHLTRTLLSGSRSAASSTAASDAVSMCCLTGVSDAREAVWLPGLVVVVEPKGLRAYRLPGK